MDNDKEAMLEKNPYETQRRGDHKTVTISTMDVLSEWQSGDTNVQSTIVNRFRVDNHGKDAAPTGLQNLRKRKRQGRDNQRPGGSDWNPALNPGVKNSLKDIQVAIERMAQATKYETINYVEEGSDVQKAWNFERPPKDYQYDELWRWLNPCIAALCVGLIGFMVAMLLKLENWLKFAPTAHFMENHQLISAYLFYVGICTLYAGISGSLVAFFAPAAAGGGIAELKMFLNGIHVPGILSLKTLIAKMVGVTFTISGGIIAGKEGPFVHAGAIVGAGIGTLGSDYITRLTKGRFKCSMPRWLGGYHRNPVDHRDFAAIGSAIGIAVAFNSPIGGVLFAVEEGASFYTRSVFWRAFMATGVAVLAVDLIFALFGCAQESSLFGIFDETAGAGFTFRLMGGFYWHLGEMIVFILIGVCGGISGAALVLVQSHLGKFRRRYIPASNGVRRVLEVMTMAFITANLWLIVLFSSPCVPRPKSAVAHTSTATHSSMHGTLSKAKFVVVEEAGGIPSVTLSPDTEGQQLPGAREEAATLGIDQPHGDGALPPQRPTPTGAEGVEGGTGHGQVGASKGAEGKMQEGMEEGATEEEEAEEAEEEELAELEKELRPQLQCPPGTFNKYGQLFFAELTGALRRMVVLGKEVPNDVIYPIEVTFVYWLLTQVMFIWSFGIGCSAGMFVPAMTFGAAFGLFTAHVVTLTAGHWWAFQPSFSAYAVIGATAFMAGTTRMIVSITILAAETTGAAGLMIPMMLTAFAAKITADSLNHGILDFAIFTKGAPVLEEAALIPHQKMILDKLQASDMMTTRIRALPLRPKLGQVLDILRTCTHSTIAITPDPDRAEAGEPFELAGVIRRIKLFFLLRHRLGVMTEERRRMHENEITTGNAMIGTSGPDSEASAQDKSLAVSLKAANVVAAHARLSHLEILQLLEELPVKLRPDDQRQILASFTEAEEEELMVDLEPFMDREPTVVGGGDTLSKIYNMFKTIGLHHVFVLQERPVVSGLICRKDLLEDIAKLKLGEKANRWQMNLLDGAITLTSMPFLPEQDQCKSYLNLPETTAFSPDEADEEMGNGASEDDV